MTYISIWYLQKKPFFHYLKMKKKLCISLLYFYLSNEATKAVCWMEGEQLVCGGGGVGWQLDQHKMLCFTLPPPTLNIRQEINGNIVRNVFFLLGKIQWVIIRRNILCYSWCPSWCRWRSNSTSFLRFSTHSKPWTLGFSSLKKVRTDRETWG